MTQADTLYLLQLPYLGESGAPVVVRINRGDARMLRDHGTHRLIGTDNVMVVTPVATAVTHHSFQIGESAY